MALNYGCHIFCVDKFTSLHRKHQKKSVSPLSPESRKALRKLFMVTGNLFFYSAVTSLFLIGIVGRGVQLGPIGTAATSRPIMLASGDYDDGENGGMMIGRGNRNTRRKPAPVLLCPPQTPYAVQTRTRAIAVGASD
jgi:hypothetical protein